jgi:hypothetical protein
MRKQVEAWQQSELSDVAAKVVIYEAFVEGGLEAPKHLARTVHDLYFEPKYEEFRPLTIWSLSNAFTSAFKELDPIPQFRATAKLGEFLEARFSQSFSSRTLRARANIRVLNYGTHALVSPFLRHWTGVARAFAVFHFPVAMRLGLDVKAALVFNHFCGQRDRTVATLSLCARS